MTSLGEKIAAEIRVAGSISFARFMELALYCPDCGYYDVERDSLGRQGDFFTSVCTGSLFGELLAFQFAEWLPPPGESEPSRLVEAGAHQGVLAHDILTWMRAHRQDLYKTLEYWILEPSTRRRAWQATRLAPFADRVRWAQDFASLWAALEHGPCSAPARLHGIIFSNELLDAFPVYRLGWDLERQTWFEWRVTSREGRFVWSKGTPEPGLALPSLPVELRAVLPHEYTLEICPSAEQWWHSAAGTLARGRLLTIDYGLTAEEWFSPERKEGTVRAYSRHHVNREVLANPGQQDLTAHVNFSAIRAVGEAAGLETDLWQSQSQFLTAIGARAWLPGAAFGEWTPARTRQFQTLVHPEHLGHSFRVLVQKR